MDTDDKLAVKGIKITVIISAWIKKVKYRRTVSEEWEDKPQIGRKYFKTYMWWNSSIQNIQKGNNKFNNNKQLDLSGPKTWHLIKENNKDGKKSKLKRYPIKYVLNENRSINKTNSKVSLHTHGTTKIKNTERIWSKNYYWLLVRMQNGISTENSLSVSYCTKHTLIIWSSNHTPWHLL